MSGVDVQRARDCVVRARRSLSALRGELAAMRSEAGGAIDDDRWSRVCRQSMALGGFLREAASAMEPPEPVEYDEDDRREALRETYWSR